MSVGARLLNSIDDVCNDEPQAVEKLCITCEWRNDMAGLTSA